MPKSETVEEGTLSLFFTLAVELLCPSPRTDFMLKRLLVVSLLFAVCLPVLAKPKKKMYGNGATDLFTAAVRTARERHVVTYVDEKMLMFTFQTGHSFFTKGFVANASVEPQDENRATLIINVQTKDGEAAFGAGDRMVDKFFDQVKEELAGQVSQKSSVKPEEASVPVAPPKAVPAEPTLTASSVSSPGRPALGTVILSATPEHAEVSVDGDFVGNAPVNLKLTPGKHTITVSAKGYQGLTRDITVMPDSEVRLTANLEQ
ncbi:MAG TPA: PEGA domain-containing protein [Candidatus Angelobacter sp.]|jgi:hypothetical protein|nr:PEGA domain-containing protein [Candidatus Angelobacter sp.]